MRFVPAYKPRSSALHSARAGVAAAYCCAFALAGALYEQPLVLGAALAGVLLAANAAGVGAEVRRTLWLSLPLALVVTLVNPLVYNEGDTLLVRGGELLGHRFDITLEALVSGALAGFRVVVIVTALGLLSAAVDPDELLKLFRRVSYRSALTASLATRLVPVLARDASRMSDAARCRAKPAERLAVLRAALSGALDRAVDVAAALEVRGYALAGKPASERVRWSRHDVSACAAAVAVAGCALAGKLFALGAVEAYPTLDLGTGAGELVLACALVGFAGLPFVGASARLGVARG